MVIELDVSVDKAETGIVESLDATPALRFVTQRSASGNSETGGRALSFPPGSLVSEPCESIMVVGVGGGGNSTVHRIVECGLDQIASLAVNTDQSALDRCSAGSRLLIGEATTAGLGAGGVPERGYDAAVESRAQLVEAFAGQDMVFLTAGLGGGTGTGASAVVAAASREAGALTIALVTLPFAFEGSPRALNATVGLRALEQEVDSLIVVSNDNLLHEGDESVGLIEAFRRVDDILLGAVQGLTKLIRGQGGGIGLDLNDVRRIVAGRGRALLGTGRAAGSEAAVQAARAAISNPLTREIDVSGAQAALVHFRAGADIPIGQVSDATRAITDSCAEDVEVIFGISLEPALADQVEVTVVLTGLVNDLSLKSVVESVVETVDEPLPPPLPPSLPRSLPVSPSSRRSPNYNDKREPPRKDHAWESPASLAERLYMKGGSWLSRRLRPGPGRLGLSAHDMNAQAAAQAALDDE